MKKKRIYFPNGDYVDREIDEYGNELMPEDEMYVEAEEEKAKIVFNHCNSVKKIYKTDLFLLYPEGMVIACQEKDNLVYVFAEAPLIGDISVSDYRKEYYKTVGDNHITDIDVRIVMKFPRSTVDESYKIMTKEQFYEDGYIDNMVNMLKKVYDVDDRSVQICVRGLSGDCNNNTIIYFGMSAMDIDRYTLNSIGTSTKRINYLRYKELKTEYLDAKSKNENIPEEKNDPERDIHEAALKEKILPPVCYELRKWLYSTSFKDFYQEIEKEVIGQPELRKILFYVYSFLKNMAYGKKVLNRNVLVTAGSGQGKTETYRALKRYFSERVPSLPVVLTDTSALTEAGYKGKEVKNLFSEIFSNNQYVNQDGRALVFLDEIDKKIYTSSRDPSFNQAAQSNLLVTIEGTTVYADKDEDPDSAHIDTSNTMFVGLGAFDYVRRDRACARDSIGFGQNAETSKKDHFYKISKQDMVDAGGIYELIGRFCDVINYQKLEKPAVEKIIEKIRANVSNDLGYEICLTKKMKDLLHRNSDSKYGCRQLDSLIREAAVTLLLNDRKREQIEKTGCIKLDVPRYEIEN